MHYTKKMHKAFAKVFWTVAVVGVLARIALTLAGVL